MTDKQLMTMMILENFWTGGLSGSITVFIGLPLVTVILRSALDTTLPISYVSVLSCL